MQLRLLLLVEDATLRTRVGRMLRDVDAFVRMPPGEQAVWDAAGQILSDVLLVSDTLLPRPAV